MHCTASSRVIRSSLWIHPQWCVEWARTSVGQNGMWNLDLNSRFLVAVYIVFQERTTAWRQLAEYPRPDTMKISNRQRGAENFA